MKTHKEKLCEKYEKAAKLRCYSTPIEDWLKVFPTAESFNSFYEDVKNLCWPETWGESPWDDAFGIAYDLHNGLSESSKKFYLKYKEDSLPKIKIMARYGVEGAAELLEEIRG